MKTILAILPVLVILACGETGAIAEATGTAVVSTLPTATATPTVTGTPTANGTPTATAVTAAPLGPMSVEVAFPGLTFSRMVALSYPDDGTDRLFLVLQPGRIVTFPNDPEADSAGVFLDITGRVNDRGNEEGLLGLAFDPEFKDNGHLYVYYRASGPRRSVLARYTVDPNDPGKADVGSERVIIEVDQPYANHNGGQVLFGPDGYLYVGLGDGGSGGDPHGHGQNVGTLLGSILRIDVRDLDDAGTYAVPPDNPFVGVAGARPEIWAYGLRNPWRYSFDRLTGDLWAADVGQDLYEEVDLIWPGRNYGWRLMEGTHCYPDPAATCDSSRLELPVTEYDHSEGCSVTGGYVYRGGRLPSLYGAYVYGDFCSGRIWGLRYQDSRVIEQRELVDTTLSISSFGEDPEGELLVLTFNGRLYRLVER